MLGLCAAISACQNAGAEVKTEKVEYKFDGVKLIGHMYYDDATKDKRPGVLVVHEWWGLDDYAKSRAEMLAKLGYVAFACDMYGDGKVAEHPKEAGEMSGLVRKNQDVWRGRAKAALAELSGFELTDASRLAAIGYCFGGTTCVQLAASGADLKAIATFHGALPKLTADDARAIQAKVQIHNGADDTFIPAAAIDSFKKALTEAKVPLEFVNYPGAVHSFTVKNADGKSNPGMKYNKDADERSWAAMKKLFDEVFKK